MSNELDHHAAPNHRGGALQAWAPHTRVAFTPTGAGRVGLLTLSGLRDLGNSITLAKLPAVASLLARPRLFRLRCKFLSTKDGV